MITPDAPMPDELIRSKNWAELTEAEKALLHGVAASEEEFRLLKLMLSVAGSQANDTPAIGTELPASLSMAFRQAEATPVRKMGWWRYAAAAAVLLGIAGTVWLVRGTNGPEPPVARNTTPAPVSTSENKTVQPISGNEKRITPPVIKVQPQSTPTQKQQPASARKQTVTPLPVKQALPEVPTHTTNTVAINTSIKENSELLQLVTAVY